MAKQRERFMTILGGYVLDMDNHGALVRDRLVLKTDGDYGADPVEDGTFRMVPSGDIVTADEKNARLSR
jgi:hypothetical protein